MSRRAISKCYTHGWTNLNASDYQSSDKLSRKLHEAKEVNKVQLAKIEEVNLRKSSKQINEQKLLLYKDL